MENNFGVPLRDFATGKTQPELALLLSVSQSAVSQMLSSTRDIWVKTNPDGSHSAIELRPVGSRRKPKAA